MTERDVFLAAVAIDDPARRADFLSDVCEGHGDLQQRVESLLRAHGGAGDFLGRDALDGMFSGSSIAFTDTVVRGRQADTTISSPQAEAEAADDSFDLRPLSFLSPALQPGNIGRLAHYEVEKVLGRGGFGTVLKAFDERLHRTVAIKVLSPELAATSPPRKRFLREARAAAAIRHQHAVAIHAVEDDPTPYLVMEFVPGLTLQEWLDQHGPLEVADVLSIGQQIAAGLAAAHSQGLVHRDIKPSNILLEGGLAGCVKITDFGLARAADDAHLTQSGAVAGTPLYMSPEQALGRAVDQRSDLFSLGSVLYCLVTGRPPFRAATSFAVLKRVVEDTPRPIADIIPECPEWLIAIIGKLHEKSPETRFATAKEVAAVLGSCLADLRAGRAVRLPAEVRPVERRSSGPRRNLVESSVGRRAPENRRTPEKHRRRNVIAAIVLLLIAGLGITEASGMTNLAGTIIRLATGSGTLVIETDAPGISVTVNGEEVRIEGAGVEQLTLRPGNYNIAATRDGKPLSQRLVTIERGGREVVRVTLEGIAAETPPGPPIAAPANGADPDRRAAEWALSVGMPVEVSVPGDLLRIAPGEKLPDAEFQLRFADLRSPQVKDAGLANFQGCQNLRSLLLNGEFVTDAGAANFRLCKSLQELVLEHTSMTDAGLSNFAGCPDLTHFSLSSRGFTDAGLAHFRDNHIRVLDLRMSQVTDAGLAQFSRVELLAGLLLSYTAVTDEGLRHFRNSPELGALELIDTKVSHAGLAHFANCTKLDNVKLDNTLVGDAGVSALKNSRGLAYLALNGTRVTDAVIPDLATFSNLKDLHLRRTGVTAAKIEELHTVLPGCRIEWDGGVVAPRLLDADRRAAEWALSQGIQVEIALGEFKQTVLPGQTLPREAFQLRSAALGGHPQATEAGLSNFAGCRHLTHLALSGPAINDAGIANFGGNRDLVTLSLENTAVTDAGLMSFADCDRLTHLIVANSPIGDAGLGAFRGCKNLQHLQLGQTKVTDRGLANFQDCPQLVEIVLGHTNVTDAGMVYFRNCRDLTALNLINTPVSDAGLENFRNCPHLTQLTLDNTRVTDAGLANFRGCTQLTRLNLSNLGVTDAGLAHFHNCDRLSELTLFGAKVTDAGLASFGKCTDLSYLLLDNTPLSDSGLEHFRNCINLKLLHLDNTQIGDAGVAHLANCHQLQQLTLLGTRVGDSGLAVLADCRQLTWLNLNGTRITNAGLTHLAELNSLADLDLRKTGVSDEGVRTLKAALPRCRIEWDGGVMEAIR